MIRHVLGSRASIGGVLGSGRGGAAAAWYLAGGVSAANCAAAYQPIGAASLSASYDNIAAPGNGLADGTYDAAPGVAPTFDTATGWTLAGSQYLTTGVVPVNNQTWSLIVRFSNVGSFGVPVFACASAAGATPYLGVEPWDNASNSRRYFAGNIYSTSTRVDNGVMAVAGNQGYYNGSADGGTIGTATGTFQAIFIGKLGLYNGFWFTGKIQALAIYNATLSAAQVAAISAAMAAL